MRTEIAQEYFKQVIHKYTSIPAEEMDGKTHFQEYGINSFMMLEMIEEMEGELGIKIPKTIFIQCVNLEEFTAYFHENYPDVLKGETDGEQEESLIDEDVL